MNVPKIDVYSRCIDLICENIVKSTGCETIFIDGANLRYCELLKGWIYEDKSISYCKSVYLLKLDFQQDLLLKLIRKYSELLKEFSIIDIGSDRSIAENIKNLVCEHIQDADSNLVEVENHYRLISSLRYERDINNLITGFFEGLSFSNNR